MTQIFSFLKLLCKRTFSSYDPKVPDGTSLAGPLGLDSTRYPNLTRKGDQPGNYEEFMNKVWLLGIIKIFFGQKILN